MALIEKDTWAQFAEHTAERNPLPFFETANSLAGHHGDGRLVIDLGCGAGVEARAFLERGWEVFAVDAEPRGIEILTSKVAPEHRHRLTTSVGRFTEVTLPEADLVYSSLALPFTGDEFDESFAAATAAVKPGGWFLAALIGPHDTWADEVVTVDANQAASLMSGFEDVVVEETEFEGGSGAGPKHWHWVVVSGRKRDR